MLYIGYIPYRFESCPDYKNILHNSGGFFIYRDKSIRSNHSLHPPVRKLTEDFIHNFIIHSFNINRGYYYVVLYNLLDYITDSGNTHHYYGYW